VRIPDECRREQNASCPRPPSSVCLHVFADTLTLSLFCFALLSCTLPSHRIPPPDQLHESFKYLKTESNRLLTAWMSGKKMKVEEIDVLEEKVEDEEDEAEANPASPDAKKQKT